jgi:hypothetical protein
MPAPERKCETCKNFAPYKGAELLRETFGKCTSGRRPTYVNFAETCRGDPSLCGPDGLWWEPLPAKFEILEDEPRALDWEDPEEEV